jgi:hypothetical protein
MNSVDKEKAYYFDLRHCTDDPLDTVQALPIPNKLSSVLLETLQLASLNHDDAKKLLITWWKKITAEPTYESPMLV